MEDLALRTRAQSSQQVGIAPSVVLQMPEHRTPCRCSRARPCQKALAAASLGPLLIAEGEVELAAHAAAVALHELEQEPYSLDEDAASCTCASEEDNRLLAAVDSKSLVVPGTVDRNAVD